MTRSLAIPAAVLGVFLGLIALLGAAFTNASTGAGTADAIGEIPAVLLPVYEAAAATCPGLPWPVLAAIGWVESRHGQGHVDAVTGDVRPPIIGPPLDGTAGRARFPDASQPDGWEHALGPMQFLPATWGAWGRVAPGRSGPPDPQNAFDAIYAAAAYLCGPGHQVTDLRAAILRYNNSDAYVTEVLTKAATYGYGTAGNLAWPVNGPITSPFGPRLDPILGNVGFHPGIDIGGTTGTPVRAPASGTVTAAGAEGSCGYSITLDHTDGLRTRYCHLSRVDVAIGQSVVVGAVIGAVGATGNATGPHLHFEVYVNDRLVDPLTRLVPHP